MACRMSLVSLILGVWLVYYVSSGIYIRFFRPPTSWKEYEGEWAIVTGASYGLGASYAKSLARRNINVALVARTKFKLEEVEKEVHKVNPKVLTKIITADLTTRECYKVIKEEMKDLVVSVLVLNAGGFHGFESFNFVDFSVYGEDMIEYDVNLNLKSPLRLSRLYLASMIQRNKGRILAVSSVASVNAYPFVSMYSATKAALENWASSIRAELSILNYDGVQIMVTVPAGIDTPLLARLPYLIQKASSKISPDYLAEIDLNIFGCETVISTAVSHSVSYHMLKLMQMLPTFVQDALTKLMLPLLMS